MHIASKKSVPLDDDVDSSARGLCFSQAKQCDWSLKESVRNSPLVGTGICLRNCVEAPVPALVWTWLLILRFPRWCTGSQMLLEGKKMFSVYAANLLWRNHYAQVRKCHSYFGIPLILEVRIICRADQKPFKKNPQINIKFLFNMVEVTGFWKTKEQSVTLLFPPKELEAFLVTQKSPKRSPILFLTSNSYLKR